MGDPQRKIWHFQITNLAADGQIRLFFCEKRTLLPMAQIDGSFKEVTYSDYHKIAESCLHGYVKTNRLTLPRSGSVQGLIQYIHCKNSTTSFSPTAENCYSQGCRRFRRPELSNQSMSIFFFCLHHYPTSIGQLYLNFIAAAY